MVCIDILRVICCYWNRFDSLEVGLVRFSIGNWCVIFQRGEREKSPLPPHFMFHSIDIIGQRNICWI